VLLLTVTRGSLPCYRNFTCHPPGMPSVMVCHAVGPEAVWTDTDAGSL
jgi:hypothetical protein